MKFRGILVVLACLPLLSLGEDMAALRKKAEQGNAEAQCRLGRIYYFGEGVPQDFKEAIRWWRLAAEEQNHVSSQGNLGVAYYQGEGVPQDYTLAYMWLNIAAAQGDLDAIENRATIIKSMTPAQIEEGQRLSREYTEKRAKK